MLQAIGGESADIPGGTVDAGLRRFSVRTSGSYTLAGGDPADRGRRRTRGPGPGGRCGECRVGLRRPDVPGRYNGRRAVFVTANQQDGWNIVRVRDGIWTELDAFQSSLPPTVSLERGFDQASERDRAALPAGKRLHDRDRPGAGDAAAAWASGRR